MTKVYVVDFNNNLGSRSWYMDSIHTKKINAIKRGKELKKSFPVDKLAMHFHDTRGMALTNIHVSLEEGIKTFDSSSGGLGGCPYAKGATGNVATEDVWYLLQSLGLETGIDIAKLALASKFILEKLNKKTESKFLTAYLNTGKI